MDCMMSGLGTTFLDFQTIMSAWVSGARLKELYYIKKCTYEVCLKNNETEGVAWELPKLQPCLCHQLRHTFLLDVQCKFQLDSINTSDLTASCVSVCSSDVLWKWRNKISSSVAWSNFALNLTKTQQKLMKN